MRHASLKFDVTLLWLLVALVILAILGGGAYYYSQKKVYQNAAAAQIKTISDLKIAELRNWRDERQRDAELILNSPTTKSLVKRYFQDTSNKVTRNDLAEMLHQWKIYNHYSRAVLLTSKLEPQLAFSSDEEWVGLLATETAQKASLSHEIVMSDLHLSARNGRPNMDIVVPLWEASAPNTSETLMGLLLFEIDADKTLYPIIQTWPTPSQTAETLIVRREGNQVVFLNELRHQTNTALRLRMDIGKSSELPAALAVTGVRGVVYGLDYRGVKVVAAIDSIPGTSWFIVAKQDLAEIDAPTQRLAWYVSLLTVVTVLSFILGAGYFWRTKETYSNRQRLIEKERSEAALKYTNSLLKATLESTTDGILVVDNMGRVTDINEQFIKVWHLPETIVAIRDNNKLREWGRQQFKEPEKFMARVREIDAQPEKDSYDLLEFKDGRVLERYSRPQRLEGIPVGRVWCFRDITERKHNEEQRENLTQQLKQKNQELEELIYAASHDLRSPLVNIEGFSRRLEHACKQIAVLLGASALAEKNNQRLNEILNEIIPKSLKYIQTGAAKMNSLIGGLLHLARLGQVMMRPEQLDMKQMMHTISNTMAYQLQKANAILEVGPMPACYGDTVLINQVFSNLIDNAIKYRDPARPLTIYISGQIEKNQIVYCVSDTGRGIPPESLSKIWELFRRLDPEGPEKGEGLGLKLVRRILDRHNGRIWGESVFGQGTRFYISLPSNPEMVNLSAKTNLFSSGN